MLFQPALLPLVQLDLDSIAEFPDQPPLWALHDLFPCHRLSLVAAPTGSGLTQLACHLASALATGPGIPTGQVILPAANPDGTRPDPIIIPNETGPRTCPNVLLISHRDHPDVLKPRLQELGVDPDQVLILSQVHREYPKVIGKPPRGRSAPFSLEDLDALSELLHEHTTIRLVLIDNADLLFAATNDPARAKVQRDLDALANVAQERAVAIVLLAGVPQLQRNPFASRLFAAMRDACRLVYFMAPDLEDPQQRLLFCIKNTLSRFNSTRKLQTLTPASPGSFRALSTDLQSLTLPHYFALLHQQRSSSHRSGPSPVAHDYAVEFLLHTLSSGPVPVGARLNPAPGSLRYLADEAGCLWGTILRAKKTLAISSHFKTDHWTWHLPATIPQLCASQSPISNFQSPIPSPLSSPSTKNQAPATDDRTCAPPPPTRGSGASPDMCLGRPAPSTAGPSATPTPYPPPATSTHDQGPMTHDSSRTCAPPPPIAAQPPVPPQDTPLHPTPTRTCAPALEPVPQSSPTVVPAPVLGRKAEESKDPEGPDAPEAPSTIPPISFSNTKYQEPSTIQPAT